MDNFPLELNESEDTIPPAPDVIQLVSDTNVESAVDDIANIIDQCHNTEQQILAEIGEYVNKCRGACESTDAECHGCILSLVQDVNTKANQLLEKCDKQITRAVQNRVGIALEGIAGFGVQIPYGDEVSGVLTGGVSQPPIQSKIVLDNSNIVDLQNGNLSQKVDPIVGNDSKVNPPLVCKGTDITYTKPDGSVICLDQSGGTVTTQTPDGNINVVHFDTPKPGGGTVTDGGSTSTGTDFQSNQICGVGSAVLAGMECIGDSRPEQVWYVVVCGSNGQFQLQTYHGWLAPIGVDPASIISHGDLLTTPKPTDDQVIAFGNKFCQQNANDKPKPTDASDQQQKEDVSCSPSALVKAYHNAQNPPAGSPFAVPDPGNPSLTQGLANSGFIGGIFATAIDSISSLFSSGEGPGGITSRVIQAAQSVSAGVVQKELAKTSCNASTFISHAATGALLNFAGGWLQSMPQAMVVTNQYLQNLSCQYLIPSVGESAGLNTRGFISDDEFQAASAANGMCIPWANCLRDASYQYPNVQEAIALYRRDRIEVDEFRDLMRKNGVKDEDMMDRFRWVNEFTFGPQDLITFMKRDTFDNDVVTKYGYDQEFDDKFTSDAEKLATAVGVTKDQMQKYWYAHWEIPGNNSLFEMAHRLREDTPIEGTDLVAKKFTLDDLAEALKINDVAPEFVNRIVATAFRVPSSIDVRRAYEIGDIEQEDLKDKYQDMGYSPNDADSKANFTKEYSADRRADLTGNITRKDIYALFRDDGIDRDTALQLLLNTGYKPQYADAKLNSISGIRDAKLLVSNIKQLKRAFLSGRYDRGEVNQILTEWKVGAERIPRIVDQWNTELNLKSKEVTIAALCKWFSLGYITGDDYLQRVRRLGYSDSDASNFVNACSTDLATKRAKELQAGIEKAQKEADKQRKEAAARAKELAPCKPPPKPVCGQTPKAHK